MGTEKTIWKTIGGNNENRIGGNSHAYTHTDKNGKKETILIDLGSMFSDKNKTGYETILPDASKHISKDGIPAEDPATAMLLTHCHMDHIGAISDYVNMGFELPKIYAPAFAIELLKATLAQARIPKSRWPKIVTIRAGQKLELGNFNIEAIAVTHSTPDSVGFYIKTPTAKIFHSGDIKTDQTVPLGKPLDFERLEEISKEDVDAIMIDSTSASKKGENPLEKDISDEFSSMMKELKGKRIVTPVIASSMQRLASICIAAAENGRTVVLEGGSLLKNYKALKNAGYDIKRIVKKKTGKNVTITDNFNKGITAKLKPEQQILICTGTQGEELAAMYRASHNNHNRLKLSAKEDVVLMTQTAIPGNEKQVKEMLDSCRNMGVQVVSAEESIKKGRPLHASGHGSAEDNKRIFTALTKHSKEKKTTVVPIHGSTEHLKANAVVAQNMGLKSVITPNFDTLEFTDNGVKSVAGKEKATWIGVNDKNNDFRNPDFEYTKVDSKFNEIEKIDYQKHVKKENKGVKKGWKGGKIKKKNKFNPATKKRGGR